MFLVTRATSGGQTGSFVGADLHSLVVVPNDPSSVFVGGHQSAAVSRDGGRTFQQVSGLQNNDAMAWSMSDDGKNQVVSGHGGLRTSDDGAATWTDRTGQLPASDVHAVGMDPGAPPTSGRTSSASECSPRPTTANRGPRLAARASS